MSQLFISYSYIGKINEVFYEGFDNIVIDNPNEYDLEIYNFIEYITEKTRSKCVTSLGMDSATTIILWWKILND